MKSRLKRRNTAEWQDDMKGIRRRKREFTPKTGRRFMYPLEEQEVYVVRGDEPVYPLTEGFYKAVGHGVIELPGRESLILVFDTYDEFEDRHTAISITVGKEIKSSDGLGELIVAFDIYERVSFDSSLIIENVDAFREMFDGTEVGVEVSENPETGLLYVTDFFNLEDTDEFPTCHEEIVRNVF